MAFDRLVGSGGPGYLLHLAPLLCAASPRLLFSFCVPTNGFPWDHRLPRDYFAHHDARGRLPGVFDDDRFMELPRSHVFPAARQTLQQPPALPAQRDTVETAASDAALC